VPADVLRERLHGDIHTVREGVEQDPGGIGIVECQNSTVTMCDRGYGRYVLHLHGQRARALAPDKPGVGTDKRFDS
jgi:hypothetical protein